MDESLQQSLLPEEQVLWEGRPATGLFLRPIEAFKIPFSFIWAYFAINWNKEVWSTNAPILFKLVGVPFLAAAFYVTIGRFLIDVLNHRHTRYFVTNRRILILHTSKLKSLDIKRISTIELEEHSQGRGTIKFGVPQSFIGRTNMGFWSTFINATPQFIHIDNVRSVYELIRHQAK